VLKDETGVGGAVLSNDDRRVLTGGRWSPARQPSAAIRSSRNSRSAGWEPSISPTTPPSTAWRHQAAARRLREPRSPWALLRRSAIRRPLRLRQHALTAPEVAGIKGGSW